LQQLSRIPRGVPLPLGALQTRIVKLMHAKTTGYSRRANEGVEIRKSKAQGTLEKKRRQQSDNNLGDMDASSLASTLTGPVDDPWSYNISSPTTSIPVRAPDGNIL
jgi:hypothetical protein